MFETGLGEELHQRYWRKLPPFGSWRNGQIHFDGTRSIGLDPTFRLSNLEAKANPPWLQFLKSEQSPNPLVDPDGVPPYVDQCIPSAAKDKIKIRVGCWSCLN